MKTKRNKPLKKSTAKTAKSPAKKAPLPCNCWTFDGRKLTRGIRIERLRSPGKRLGVALCREGGRAVRGIPIADSKLSRPHVERGTVTSASLNRVRREVTSWYLEGGDVAVLLLDVACSRLEAISGCADSELLARGHAENQDCGLNDGRSFTYGGVTPRALLEIPLAAASATSDSRPPPICSAVSVTFWDGFVERSVIIGTDPLREQGSGSGELWVTSKRRYERIHRAIAAASARKLFQASQKWQAKRAKKNEKEKKPR